MIKKFEIFIDSVQINEEEYIDSNTPYFRELKIDEYTSKFSISKTHIHKIINRLGFTNYRYIDKGNMGFIYKVWDKTDQKIKVVKITTDIEEAHFANSFRNKNPKHLATYYDIREIYYNDKPTNTYSIVMDIAKPLNKLQKDIWGGYGFEYGYFANMSDEKFINNNLGRILLTEFQQGDDFLNFKEKGLKRWHDEHKNVVERIKKFIKILLYQRQSVLTEYRKYRHKVVDAHKGNVGFKLDGTFVILDPSFGSNFRSKKPTLSPIKIYGKEND